MNSSHGFGSAESESNLSLTSSSAYNFPPNSPISPRVKNIKEDMEALLISRQDNPYISQKLEMLSSCNDCSLSTTTLSNSISMSVNGDLETEQSLVAMDDAEVAEACMGHLLDEPGLNLHEHLIRSPPPQFPQKVSHFVFPDSVGSPLRGMLSPRPATRNSLQSPRPDVSLCSLAGDRPSSLVTMQFGAPAASRRCSHPMDEDISTPLGLAPLLPVKRNPINLCSLSKHGPAMAGDVLVKDVGA
ncbi:hypothetical protein HDE_14221 [Halotydeus destructor]|nr:hypothetical protein HDE_14221 [Halotydeus destructor]